MQKIKELFFPICLLLWMIAYAGLLATKLLQYDGFYTTEYSSTYHIFGIFNMTILCIAFGVCTYKNWQKNIPEAGFTVICAVMIFVFFFPPISPFDFFLLTHRNQHNPFAGCKGDCALPIEPSAYQMGINETSDAFVIYSPLDRFRGCVEIELNEFCKKLVLSIAFDEHYGVNEMCNFSINRLSKAYYYKLSTHNCR